MILVLYLVQIRRQLDELNFENWCDLLIIIFNKRMTVFMSAKLHV